MSQRTTAIYNGVSQNHTTATRLAHLDATAKRLRSTLGRPLRILEIGSLFGVSACVLVRHGTVWCIDLWEFGNQEFLAAIAGLPVVWLKGNSTDQLNGLIRETQFDTEGAKFDLIYIDGDHTYPVIETDIQQAKQLIRPGGIICGDDLEKQLVSDSKEEITEAVKYRRTDCINGYHPGVSLAVLLQFGHVEMADGFWWVQQ